MTPFACRGRLRRGGFALVLLLLSCEQPGDRGRPFDGGRAIDRNPPIAGVPEIRQRDPCWRRERGGWHHSVVHCTRMAPPERMTGVWITGFEEMSFIRGATAMPDRNHPQRYRNEIEIDATQVEQMMGRPPGMGYTAVAITFIGRRSLYPYLITCDGQRSYSYVVTRLDSARYLGLIADPDPPPLPSQRPPPTFRPTGASGELGRLEAEAVARCSPPLQAFP